MIHGNNYLIYWTLLSILDCWCCLVFICGNAFVDIGYEEQIQPWTPTWNTYDWTLKLRTIGSYLVMNSTSYSSPVKKKKKKIYSVGYSFKFEL